MLSNVGSFDRFIRLLLISGCLILFWAISLQ